VQRRRSVSCVRPVISTTFCGDLQRARAISRPLERARRSTGASHFQSRSRPSPSDATPLGSSRRSARRQLQRQRREVGARLHLHPCPSRRAIRRLGFTGDDLPADDRTEVDLRDQLIVLVHVHLGCELEAARLTAQVIERDDRSSYLRYCKARPFEERRKAPSPFTASRAAVAEKRPSEKGLSQQRSGPYGKRIA